MSDQNNTSSNTVTSFVEQLTGDEYLRVQDDLGNGYVRLRAAEAQRRQAKQDIRFFEDVVIEMLRNARDAGAKTIYVATRTEQNIRYLTLLDDGSGIPADLHELVFEPFVTSKLDTFHADSWGVHGRGMALYSIRENTDKAFIVVSEKGRGSVFHVEASLSTLPEKRDQSSWPVVSYTENGTPVLRGPHNIIRTVMEFAIQHRSTLTVYLGSPVEIAATLYSEGLKHREEDAFRRLTRQDDALFVDQLALSYNPEDFAERASMLALPLSSRSARRILDGDIQPIAPIIALLMAHTAQHQDSLLADKGASAKKAAPLSSAIKNERGLKISPEDLQTFEQSLQNSYQMIAQAYYLDPSVKPHIRVTKDRISVTWDVQNLH